MPNYEITSPLFLIILLIFFLTYCIRSQDRAILLSIQKGNIIRPLNSKFRLIYYPLRLIAAVILIILNWKFALSFMTSLIILDWIGVLEIIGGLVLFPFLKKVPSDVESEHLEAANAMFVYCNEYYLEVVDPQYANAKTKNMDYDARFDFAEDKFNKFELNDENLNSVINALNYLGASNFVKSETLEFYKLLIDLRKYG